VALQGLKQDQELPLVHHDVEDDGVELRHVLQFRHCLKASVGVLDAKFTCQVLLEGGENSSRISFMPED
jgi:hypothetical protein